MGGGSQGKARAVQYAHAVPPSWNAGGMVVLVQRAYFSAWRMRVRRAVRDGGEGGPALWTRDGRAHPRHQPVGCVRGCAERLAVDQHGSTRTDARVRRAKEDRHRLAVDAVVARVVHRGRPSGGGKGTVPQGAASTGCLARRTAAGGRSTCRTRRSRRSGNSRRPAAGARWSRGSCGRPARAA